MDREREDDEAGTALPKLLRQARAGEEHAWRTLVRRYERLVWATARAHRLNSADAADVAQLTWLRLAERLDTLRDPRTDCPAGW